MPEARIADLKVDVGASLTQETRKGLIKIVNDEFQRKQTVFSYKSQQAKDKVLEDYKKSSGFEGLMENLRAKRAEVRAAEDKLFEIGFDQSGQLFQEFNQSVKNNDKVLKRVQDLNKQLRDVANAILPAQNFKSKIITRLLVATKVGEAMVLMKEVLGNDVIPSIQVSELEQLVITDQSTS